ncbi:MAG TPA: OmpA family protein [Spirochaetota bacterium]
MKIYFPISMIACLSVIFAVGSCSLFQTKDSQTALDRLEEQKGRLEIALWDLQLQMDDKNAELKKVMTERDQLAKDNEELKKSLTEKSDQLSKMIATLSSEKQNLERKLATMQKSADVQKAQEDREIASAKTSYDKLMGDLKKEIDDKSVEVQQYKGMLTINIVDRIFFDSGKADIKTQGYSVLNRVGAILKNMPDKVIQIEGHTDDVPIAAEYQNVFPNNWALGSRRAVNVAVYLIDKLNIDPKNIEVISFSKYRPRVPNTSEENRAKNRRIEIVVANRSLYQHLEMEKSLNQ